MPCQLRPVKGETVCDMQCPLQIYYFFAFKLQLSAAVKFAYVNLKLNRHQLFHSISKLPERAKVQRGLLGYKEIDRDLVESGFLQISSPP